MKKSTFFYILMPVLLMLLVLSACNSKKDSKSKDDDDDRTEQKAAEDEEEDALTEVTAQAGDYMDEQAPVDSLSGEELLDKEEAKEAESDYDNEVWPYIGGTYPFSDGTTNVIVETVPGDDKALTINFFTDDSDDGDKYNGEHNAEGRIRAYDDDGQLVFEGYLYRGGNLLKGTYKGKPVRYNGMGGL